MQRMTLYVLRNKATGEYWGYGDTEVYTDIEAARRRCGLLTNCNEDPHEIVALSATVTGVIE